jgi:hypothetical protein
MSIVVRGTGRCLLLTGTCDERNQTKREKELAAHRNGFFLEKFDGSLLRG